MKRQLVCEKCGHRPLGEHRVLAFYGSERAITVMGIARQDYLCDLCNAEIPAGTPCYAQSIGTKRMLYYPWEGEYLK